MFISPFSCRFPSSKPLQLLFLFFFQIVPCVVHLHINILIQVSTSQRDLVRLLYLKLSNLSPSSHLPITLYLIIMSFFIAYIIVWIYLNNLLSAFIIWFLPTLECKHSESRKHVSLIQLHNLNTSKNIWHIVGGEYYMDEWMVGWIEIRVI